MIRRHSRKQSFLSKIFALLGPGLITGASDDDPSGIATYSQAGAGFGFGLLWTMFFSLPLMSSIQEISARVGRTTGRGIAGNVRDHYSRWLLYPVVFLLVLANTINLGADIGAMGDAMALVIHGPSLLYAAFFAGLSLSLEVFIQYKRYAKFLKWMTLVLLSYVVTVFMVHVPWGKALLATAVPRLERSGDYWAMFIAIFGTTISPYLFFWQASEEVEEIENHSAEHSLIDDPKEAPEQFRRIRIDTWTGMTFSNLVAFFIILCAAVTLHAHRITDIQTSAQAAQALRPLAGPLTFFLFTLGIVGTGLLGLPVLAGSAAYAVGEACKWPCGLARKPLDAKAFYCTLCAATIIGLALNFPVVQRVTHITPIKALVWSAVLNGIVAVPVMAVIMILVRNRKVMGEFVLKSRWHLITGWLATAVMAAASVGMVVTWKS